jgi:hypothetical protein
MPRTPAKLRLMASNPLCLGEQAKSTYFSINYSIIQILPFVKNIFNAGESGIIPPYANSSNLAIYASFWQRFMGTCCR